jgi:hypothetical protein
MLRTLGCGIVITLILGGVVTAEEKKTLKERMNAEKQIVVDNLRSANWRLDKNFAGIQSSRAEAPAEQATPFRRCCSFSIGKIEAGIEALSGIFDEMARCYQRRGQDTARADLAIVRSDLAAYVRLLDEMTEAATIPEAQEKGEAATRAYFDFDKSSSALPDCAKGKKKKKKSE